MWLWCFFLLQASDTFWGGGEEQGGKTSLSYQVSNVIITIVNVIFNFNNCWRFSKSYSFLVFSLANVLHQSLEPEDAAKVFMFSLKILQISNVPVLGRTWYVSILLLQVLEVAVDHDPTESVRHSSWCWRWWQPSGGALHPWQCVRSFDAVQQVHSKLWLRPQVF